MVRIVQPLLFCLLTIACIHTASAQQRLSPEEAIRLALDNNYGVRIARNEADIAANNVTLGNAGFLPTVDATTSYGGSNVTTRQEFNTGAIIDRTGAVSSTYTAGVGLDWTLFDGFRMFVDYDRLGTLKEAGELQLRQSMEQTVLDVTSTYFDIVRQEYLLQVYRNALELSRERIRLAEARASVGTGAAPDLLKARVDLNTDSSNLIRQEIALVETRALLNTLLGRPASQDFTVEEAIPTGGNLDLDVLRAAALERNSALRAAELNRELAQLELDAVQSLHYPIIGVSAGYNFAQSSNQAGLVLSNRSYGPTYSINAGIRLFDGLNVQRQEENARVLIGIRELEAAQLRTTIEADVLTTYRTYQTNRDLLRLEEQNLEAARRNADIAAERLRVGTITSYELREIQRDLLEAESRIISARYQAKLAEARLLLLSGGMLQ